MQEISAVKTIKHSGSSLAVYITRELTMLGVEKGQKVEIIIRKVE